MRTEKKSSIKNSATRLILIGLLVLIQTGWMIFLMMKLNTYSTAITLLLTFIAMFIAQGAFSLTAHSSKYIENAFYDENGNKHIISQEIDPNYPGDQKVKTAKIIYLSIPQGQAMEIKNNNLDSLQQMTIYSIILIVIINILGVYIFSKKELK